MSKSDSNDETRGPTPALRFSRLDLLVVCALAALTFGTRLATRARFPTEWDSAQLAIGVLHFDVRVHEPHPPGYWLYVFLGRLVHLVSGADAVVSLEVVAAFGAALSVVGAYLLGSAARNRWLGIASAALTMSSPLAWFYGSIPATYVWDLAGSMFAMFFALRARVVGARAAVACVVTIGLIGGFRSSLIVFLAPVALVAVALARPTIRQVVLIVASGAASVLVWLVPMALEQPGGIAVLRRENSEMWLNAAKFTSPFFGASEVMIEATKWRALGWTTASLIPAFVAGVVGLAVIVPRFRSDEEATTPARLVFALAALVATPQLFSAVFLHFGKSGYVLGFQGALTVAALYPAAALHKVGRVLASVLVVGASAFGVRQFISAEGLLPRRVTNTVAQYRDGNNEAPFTATRRTITAVDDDLATFSLSERFDESSTVFVFAPGPGAIRYRQVSYTHPGLRLHLVADGYDWATSNARRQRYERDRVVEVPAGWEAVVASGPPNELEQLAASGLAEPVELGPGQVVWVVERGTTIAGVRIG